MSGSALAGVKVVIGDDGTPMASCTYGFSLVVPVTVTVHEPPPDIHAHYPIHLNHLLEPVSSMRIENTLFFLEAIIKCSQLRP